MQLCVIPHQYRNNQITRLLWKLRYTWKGIERQVTVSEVTGQINSNHPSPPQAGFVRPIDHSLGFEVCAGDATRQRAGIEGRHVAAHRGHAGNEAADRLAEAGRRWWMVPERATALISCAPSVPLEPEVHFATLAVRIFWAVDQGRGRSVEAFFGWQTVSRGGGAYFWLRQRPHVLPAERSAVSPAGPLAMSGRRVDLADQFYQAGISIVGTQETRCRGQVTGSCRGFGVFAAAADKAGNGGAEL